MSTSTARLSRSGTPRSAFNSHDPLGRAGRPIDGQGAWWTTRPATTVAANRAPDAVRVGQRLVVEDAQVTGLARKQSPLDGRTVGMAGEQGDGARQRNGLSGTEEAPTAGLSSVDGRNRQPGVIGSERGVGTRGDTDSGGRQGGASMEAGKITRIHILQIRVAALEDESGVDDDRDSQCGHPREDVFGHDRCVLDTVP